MDILTFKSFISIEALIIFYYMGAIILPVGLWYLLSWMIRRYNFVAVSYKRGKEVVWDSLQGRQKVKLLISFMTIFLFMELFWRILFEFLIAYMQMRDAIIQAAIN